MAASCSTDEKDPVKAARRRQGAREEASEDDTSTVASSDAADELERELLAFAQLDDVVADGCGKQSSSARWADLHDSDDEVEREALRGAASSGWTPAEEFVDSVSSPKEDEKELCQASRADAAPLPEGAAAATNGVGEPLQQWWLPGDAAAWERGEPWAYGWAVHSAWLEAWRADAASTERREADQDATEQREEQCPPIGHDGSKWWLQPWAAEEAQWWAVKQRDWSRQCWTTTRQEVVRMLGVEHRPMGMVKPQCQFFIGIEEEPAFRVTRRLLGPHGQHVKAIAERSWAKLRLRGQGSGFSEGPEQQESGDELMLCVSAPDAACYVEAVRLVSELLEDVYEQYRAFLHSSGEPVPELAIRMHEGPRAGSR